MYKFDTNRQFEITDFNQPAGFQMNPENRWIKKAAVIPWDAIEKKYAKLFPSKTGTVAKPLRMALGSLLIQKQLGFSDRELIEELTENPYFQYFIGLPGYQDKAPFVPSLLVEFRKRLSEEILLDINEMILSYSAPDDPTDPPKNGKKRKAEEASEAVTENSGTVILDATCAPANIAYPQDVNLLNEAREDLEKILDSICERENYYRERTYRKKARKDYLALAKSKKRSAKKIRKAIRKQLGYIRRDLGYIESYKDDEGVVLSSKEEALLGIIYELYEQQKYMYENKCHNVANRIVSISQPYIRPIVRGKAKAPVEFGAKLDLSLDEDGLARIEKMSFDAYNECSVLIDAVERYRERTGHYPERVLADQIYRTRSNLRYCKENSIRMSGPRLGRPKDDASRDKKLEYKDNTDRIAVERAFALAKHKYGLGLVVTKTGETTKTSIILSIIAMNVAKITATFLCALLWDLFSRYNATAEAEAETLKNQVVEKLAA